MNLLQEPGRAGGKALTQDFSRLPYSRARRPIGPLDPLPA
jgi:hypothetical protein